MFFGFLKLIFWIKKTKKRIGFYLKLNPLFFYDFLTAFLVNFLIVLLANLKTLLAAFDKFLPPV